MLCYKVSSPPLNLLYLDSVRISPVCGEGADDWLTIVSADEDNSNKFWAPLLALDEEETIWGIRIKLG